MVTHALFYRHMGMARERAGRCDDCCLLHSGIHPRELVCCGLAQRLANSEMDVAPEIVDYIWRRIVAIEFLKSVGFEIALSVRRSEEHTSELQSIMRISY